MKRNSRQQNEAAKAARVAAWAKKEVKPEVKAEETPIKITALGYIGADRQAVRNQEPAQVMPLTPNYSEVANA